MDDIPIWKLIVLTVVVLLVYGVPLARRGEPITRDPAAVKAWSRRIDYLISGGALIFGLGALLFGHKAEGIGGLAAGIGLFIRGAIQRRLEDRARSGSYGPGDRL